MQEQVGTIDLFLLLPGTTALASAAPALVGL